MKQTSKSPSSETPKKLGRPRGRKSDPSYRQVTIYIPTALHDMARQVILKSQLSSNKTEHQTFSGLIEVLLKGYFQTSESPESRLTLVEMADELRNQSAKIAAMSDEEWTQFSYKRTGPRRAEDTENDKEIAEAENWAAQGLITAAELKKYQKFFTTSGTRPRQELDWLLLVRKRVRSKISAQKNPPSGTGQPKTG